MTIQWEKEILLFVGWLHFTFLLYEFDMKIDHLTSQKINKGF